MKTLHGRLVRGRRLAAVTQAEAFTATALANLEVTYAVLERQAVGVAELPGSLGLTNLPCLINGIELILFRNTLPCEP